MIDQEHRDPSLHDAPEPTPGARAEAPEAQAPTALARRAGPGAGVRPLPWYVGHLMTAHLLVSRDLTQHRSWRQQIEGLRMLDVLPRVKGHQTRALVRRPRVWRRIQAVSRAGATVNFSASLLWLIWIIPLYAIGHGFGWLAALTFLLPVPIAWRVARRLFEDAAIGSIQDAQDTQALAPVLGRWTRSGARTFIAGFGFGFTLLFLQGLLTWFMTPASTIAMELFMDAWYASIAGLLSGGVSVIMTPLVATTGPAALQAAPDRPRIEG